MGREWAALREYGALARWVWRDGIGRFRPELLAIAFASALDLACQLAAFQILFVYGRALETDAVLPVLAVPARSSSLALLAAAVAAFLLLAAHSWLGYAASTRSVRLRRRYEELCEKRILMLASRLPHPLAPRASHMLAAGLVEANASRWPRSCGMVVRLLLNGLVPAARLLLSAAVILYVSLASSLLVFTLFGVAAFFLHRVNRTTARVVRLAEEHRAASSEERRLLHRRSRSAPARIDYGDRAAREIFERGDTARFLDAFFQRYELAEQTSLVIHLLTAASLLAVLLVGGMRILAGAPGWSTFLAYLVALRFFMTSLMQIGRMLTEASRFYPHILDHQRFVTDAERVREDAPGPCAGAIWLDVPCADVASDRLELRPGAPVFLAHPGPVDRRLVALLASRTHCDGLEPSRLSAGLYWFVGTPALEGTTLRELHGLPPQLDAKTALAALATLSSFASGVEATLPDLDRVLEAAEIEAISPELLRLLGILGALHSGCPVVVLAESDLALMRAGPADTARALMDRRLVVVTRRLPSAACARAESAVVLAAAGALGGWCRLAWLREHPELFAGPALHEEDAGETPEAVLEKVEDDA